MLDSKLRKHFNNTKIQIKVLFTYYAKVKYLQ